MREETKCRVVVVDDFRLSRDFFEMYVKSAARYELIRSFLRAEDAAAFCETADVQLVIMDVLMRSGTDGLTAAARIKEKRPDIRIILTTSAAEAAWEEKARRAGVESFWYKEHSEESLLDVMDRTMAGQSVYPSHAPRVAFGRASREQLSPRELDVLRELTLGLSNEEIGRKLGMSVNTVRVHIHSMLNKTGFENRLDLALNAKVLGLVVSETERLASADTP